MQTSTNTTKAIIAIIIIILIGLAVYATRGTTNEETDTDMASSTVNTSTTTSNNKTKNNSVLGTNNGTMPVARPGEVITVTAKKNPLAGTSWVWKDTSFNNKASSTVPGNSKFMITFGTDGAVTSSTDCNSVSGRYTVTNDKVNISNTASTRMACSGASLEGDYVNQLTQVTNFTFESLNELDLMIGGTATMSFSRR